MVRTFTVSDIRTLQATPEKIRNMCILAHVDHGKTTLADTLVASNGIISQKMAGKLRYMDSRKDEQERGITMKSSCISLGFRDDDTSESYLINLIDSPGHVDFCGEVSAAVRLCDGALIIVDAVEGVCPQTISALRQAWVENLKALLVINKVDRLITEQQMTPLDAYIRLQQLVEQINVIVGELFTSDVFSKEEDRERRIRKDSKREETDPQESFTFDWSNPLEEEDDSDLYFDPQQGNVIFASALDGWAFSVQSFADFLSRKLGINAQVLKKTLWGDYYLDNKKKRIFKGAQSSIKKPLFVHLVLENIWSVYDTVFVRRDKEKTQKVIESLKLSLPARDVNHTDARVPLKSIMSNWLPLSQVVLSSVCKRLPSPLNLSEIRVENLMCSRLRKFESFPVQTQELKKHFLKCSSDENDPKIIFVSKMFSVNRKCLPEHKPKILSAAEIEARRTAYKMQQLNLQNEDKKENQSDINGIPSNPENAQVDENCEDVFIAFARVFSGKLKVGDSLFVLGPKYDPSNEPPSTIDDSLTLKDLKSDEHITKTVIKRLFLLMGRELEEVDEAPAGSVIGISDMEQHILKSATLSDSLYCPPFVDLHVVSEPILAVAIEPQDPRDMAALIRGLKYLDQSDPNVIVRLEDTGEHVIITPGEVHLQKCIDDLQTTFAKIQLSVSKPIIPFKETVVLPPKVDMVNENIETQNHSQEKQSNNPVVEMLTPNKSCIIKIKAIPLPDIVSKFLEEQSSTLKMISSLSGTEYAKSDQRDRLRDRLDQLYQEEECKDYERIDVKRIVAFGPKNRGPNILVDCTKESVLPSLFAESSTTFDTESLTTVHFNSFTNGFQLASVSGPLCEEPIYGVAFCVLEWSFLEHEEKSSDPFGPLSGQVMSTVKEACRRAFNCQPRRLKLAMYSCNIQVPSEALGK